jgi:hypothetical protein
MNKFDLEFITDGLRNYIYWENSTDGSLHKYNYQMNLNYLNRRGEGMDDCFDIVLPI